MKKESKKKMSKGKKVLVVIAIVVGLFLGLAMCGSTVEDEPVAKAKQAEALTPLEQVKADAKEADVDGLKIVKKGSNITVVFEVGDNLSAEMVIQGARIDSRTIVGALEDNGVEYKDLDITGTLDMEYVDGTKAPNEEVYYVYILHEGVADMEPGAVTAEAFADLAEVEVIDPALR